MKIITFFITMLVALSFHVSANNSLETALFTIN